MNSQITIAKAVSQDAFGISLVRRKTWLTTYPNKKENITKEDIEAAINERTIEEEAARRANRIINNRDIQIWVGKDKSSIIGFIEAQKAKERNRISAFYIIPENQNQGIGTEFMIKALKWLGSEKMITCEVASYNTNAIAFYKKFGFKENGITRNEVSKLPSGKEIPEIEMIRQL